MLIVRCPYCGERPEIEFRHGGEAHIARPADPNATSDAEWADYLYNRTNPKGLHVERWRHVYGCGRFFNAVRDTVSDFFLATYKVGEPPPRRSERATPMNAFRLPTGGRIDRSKPLRFTFDGRAHEGFAGDTLASALIANGVHLVGRSFKYHRPRGILAAGADEPNALVTLVRDNARQTPNLRATQVELYDGLTAESQNRWPSLAFDLAAANNLIAPLIPAGFYYKTFMWPRFAWKRLYEPRIRAMAGLGRAPKQGDPDRYAQCYAHCDVLVIGAGPAGLAATLAAAECGAHVMLCDEQAEPGGSLLASETVIDGRLARAWLAETIEARQEPPQRHAAAAHDRLRLLPAQHGRSCRTGQ